MNALKDERPTLNIERRMSNNDVASLGNLISFVLKIRCRILNNYFFFFSAVLMLVTNILINSFVSSDISFSGSDFLTNGTF
jgi:hypothetical protein